MPLAAAVLAAIPSPGSGDISIGPLRFTAYGLMIAIGVIVAVEIGRRRAPGRGIDPDDMTAIATWAVPAGLLGARLYHVITDWQRFDDDLGDIPKIWEGGLGIWGGIAAGSVVGVWVARRRGLHVPTVLDAAAPALPLAQAIGRLGNWFNQELFGRPTDLPWGLEIDPDQRPDGYEAFATFHPTFLYEMLWNLLVVGVLLLVDQRVRLRPGKLFVLYVAGYTFGRFFIEGVRIDEANTIAGLRVNEWVSAAVCLAALAVLLRGGLRRRPGDVDVARPGTEQASEADTSTDADATDRS